MTYGPYKSQEDAERATGDGSELDAMEDASARRWTILYEDRDGNVEMYGGYESYEDARDAGSHVAAEDRDGIVTIREEER